MNLKSGCEIPPTYQQSFGYYLGYRILENNKTTLDITLPPIKDLSGFSGSILETLRSEYFVALATGNDISLNSIINDTNIWLIGYWNGTSLPRSFSKCI